MPLDNKRVAADQQAILALGYFTDVKTDIHATPGGVAVSYIVVENPVVSKLVFTGNKQVTGDVLLALMDTTIGTVLNTNTLRDDIQKINSYYDKLGFIGTRHVQDIKIDANGTINIAIKEGVTVTKVNVTGNTVFPTPVILAVMKTKAGVTFSGQQFNDDLNSIQNLYKDAGLSAVLDGAPDVDNPGVVNVTICEAKVGAIEIAGNSITKDYVIRRLLRLHPGSLVSDAGLRQDYEAINNTQFFKSVDLGTKPFGSKCGYLTLVWTVVEQRTGTAGVNLSYGGGGQYGQGFGVGVSFAQNNVAGTGDSASINLQKGQHFSNVNFSVGVPYIQKFKANSVSFSIFNNLQNDQPRPVYKVPGNNPFYSTTPVTSLGHDDEPEQRFDGTDGGDIGSVPSQRSALLEPIREFHLSQFGRRGDLRPPGRDVHALELRPHRHAAVPRGQCVGLPAGVPQPGLGQHLARHDRRVTDPERLDHAAQLHPGHLQRQPRRHRQPASRRHVGLLRGDFAPSLRLGLRLRQGRLRLDALLAVPQAFNAGAAFQRGASRTAVPRRCPTTTSSACQTSSCEAPNTSITAIASCSRRPRCGCR